MDNSALSIIDKLSTKRTTVYMVVQFGDNWIKQYLKQTNQTQHMALSNFGCHQNFFNQLLVCPNWTACSPRPCTYAINLIRTATSFVTENLSEVELWKMDANISVNNPVNKNKSNNDQQRIFL